MRTLNTIRFSLLAVFMALVLAGVNARAGTGPERKIVVFKSGVLNEAARDRLIERVGGAKVKNLDLIGAAAVLLPSRASEEAIAKHPGVLRVDDDVIVIALEGEVEAAGNGGVTAQAAQVLPWGIDRIDAELVWAQTKANPIKVGIIDTGISLAHPDLAANIKGQYNAINPTKSAADDNGHGSHVAGTVAALSNTVGVIGAAPLADLYAMKVLKY